MKWQKKLQYGLERYKNVLEDKKQKLVEYRKNIIEWEKMSYYNYKKQLFQKMTKKFLFLMNVLKI